MKRSRFDENDSQENVIKRQNRKNYDDKSYQHDIMSMSQLDRQRYVNNTINPFGYPKEYFEIYEREKLIRNPVGFNHLLNIDDIKLFEKRNDQIVSKTRIQQFLNVNCIKSRHTDNIDLESIFFGGETIQMLKDHGIDYIGEFGEFLDYMKKTDETYLSKYESIDMDDYDGYDKVEQLNEEFYEYCTTEYNKRLDEGISDPNKYRVIIKILNLVFGDLSQYICIAGGFALSMYIFEKYGYSVNFNDIDLFIHSCDEQTANRIVQLLKNVTQSKSMMNDNVIMSMFNTTNYSDYDEISSENEEHMINHNITFIDKMRSIQIIKRLYTSPSQIIHGFDVDSCCILSTLDGNVFITERGSYALRTGYNTLNFDRLSPSYEYRLMKYNRRGFGLWIPFVEYFKDNCIFDVDIIDKNKTSSIIIKDLFIETPKRGTLKNVEKVSDYYSFHNSRSGNKNVLGEYITFKTLNPSEQIINTFHRIVLSDVKEWYPLKTETIHMNTSINHLSTEIIEIQPIYKRNSLSSDNIVNKTKKNKFNERAQMVCQNILKYIDHILPDSEITGRIVLPALSGIMDYGSINIYNEQLIGNIQRQQLVNYELQKYIFLSTIKNSLVQYIPELNNIVDSNLMGDILFLQNRGGKTNIGKGENFYNYQNFPNEPSSYFKYSFFGEQDKNSLVVFKPSEEVYVLINNLKEKLYSDLSQLYDTNGEYSRPTITYVHNYSFGNKYSNDMLKIDDITYLEIRQIHSFYNKIFEDYNIFNEVIKQVNSIVKHLYLNGEYKKIKNFIKFNYIDIINGLSQEFKHIAKIYVINNSTIFYGYLFIKPVNFLNEPNDEFEDVLYKNGKYYSSEYDYNLFSAGIRHKNIMKKDVIVYDSPVYEQYFPM